MHLVTPSIASCIMHPPSQQQETADNSNGKKHHREQDDTCACPVHLVGRHQLLVSKSPPEEHDHINPRDNHQGQHCQPLADTHHRIVLKIRLPPVSLGLVYPFAKHNTVSFCRLTAGEVIRNGTGRQKNSIPFCENSAHPHKIVSKMSCSWTLRTRILTF